MVRVIEIALAAGLSSKSWDGRSVSERKVGQMPSRDLRLILSSTLRIGACSVLVAMSLTHCGSCGGGKNAKGNSDGGDEAADANGAHAKMTGPWSATMVAYALDTSIHAQWTSDDGLLVR